MDAIFNLNMPESKKVGKLILETYEGKIKKLKNKTFSGQLIKSDLLEHNYEILSNKEKKHLLGILNKNTEVRISKNKLMLKLLDEENILNLLKETNTLYATHKNRKMYLVENILRLNIESEGLKYSKKNGYFKFCFKEVKFEIKDDKDFIVLDDKTIVLYSNSLIIIDKELEKKIVDNEESIWYCKLKNEDKENIEIIKPSARLYLKNINGKVNGELKFLYGYREINSDSKVEIIENQYYRDLETEKKFINILMSMKWKKRKGSIFEKENLNNKEINFLRDSNIKLFVKETKKEISNVDFNVVIKNNTDWFDLDIDIELNNKVYKLFDLMKNYKDKDYVEIENNSILIPKEIKEIVSLADKDSNIDKKYLGDLYILNDFLKLNLQNIKFNFKNIDIDLSGFYNINLRDYQILGIKWIKYMYLNKIGACLADDMGMGKTMQVIGFLSDKEYNIANKKVLVIVPKSLLINWKREFEKFNREIKVNLYYGQNRVLKNSEVILTTYHTLINDFDKFKNVQFNTIIIDEIQYLKNSKSKTYKIINQIKSDFILGLSGTPFENNILEVLAIMNLLNKGVLKKEKDFIRKYNENLTLLNKKIEPYFLRRVKKDFLKELPEKAEEIIFIEMNQNQKNLYESIRLSIKDSLYRDNRYEIKDASIVLEGLLKLRQVCCHPKLLKNSNKIENTIISEKFEALKELVKKIISNKEKLVIFSSFTSMLDIIEQWLLNEKIKSFRIDGKVRDRQKIVDQFEKECSSVCLVSMKAGGVGLNMVSCKYAIIYDLWWNPAVVTQAEDRIYRIGQERDVTIYKLIMLDTIEEKILGLNNKKKEIGKELFNNTHDNILSLVENFLE